MCIFPLFFVSSFQSNFCPFILHRSFFRECSEEIAFPSMIVRGIITSTVIIASVSSPVLFASIVHYSANSDFAPRDAQAKERDGEEGIFALTIKSN